MMEEVCVSPAVLKDLSEDDIIARLVCDASPKRQVPSKDLKLQEKRVNTHDSLYRYQMENQKLQEASERLEQENDNLALTLITSKISLRKALDKAEDKVEELTERLSLTNQRLTEVEEEKREKDLVTAQLKQVFRIEMERAEAEMQKMSSIIAEYKQICSQLSTELEKQKCKAGKELAHVKSGMKDCTRCGRALVPSSGRTSELERELVHSKVQMVQPTCKLQELENQKEALLTDHHASKHSWLRKPFT